MLEESRLALVLVLLALAISLSALIHSMNSPSVIVIREDDRLKQDSTTSSIQLREEKRPQTFEKTSKSRKTIGRETIPQVIAEEEYSYELREWAISNGIPWEELPQEAKDAFIYWDPGLESHFRFASEEFIVAYLGYPDSQRAQDAMSVIQKTLWANAVPDTPLGYKLHERVQVLLIDEISDPTTCRSNDFLVLIIDGFWFQGNQNLAVQSINNCIEGRKQSGAYEDGIGMKILILGNGIGPIQAVYQNIDQIAPGASELIRKDREVDEMHYPEEVYYVIEVEFIPDEEGESIPPYGVMTQSGVFLVDLHINPIYVKEIPHYGSILIDVGSNQLISPGEHLISLRDLIGNWGALVYSSLINL